MQKMFVGLVISVKKFLGTLPDLLKFRKKEKATDGELWNAFIKAEGEHEAAWVRYEGEKDDDGHVITPGDRTSESLEKYYAASRAEVEAIFDFFGDRRLHEEELAALEVCRKLRDQLEIADAERRRLHELKERIRRHFTGELELGTAIEIRDRLLAEEKKRRAAHRQ